MVAYFPEDPDDFVDDLEKQISAYIINVMPADPSGELETLPLTDLLIAYGNWRSRWVPAHPRAVHWSSKLRSSLHTASHQVALNAISAAAQAGDDLTPYLSRSINNAYVPQAKRSARLDHRSDLDLLMSDWGLHHLHLSTKLCSNGLMERTGDLLFAAFTHDDAYLIGIFPHGSWTQKELIEVLVREWPNDSVVATLKGGLTLASHVNEHDHQELRNAGVTTLMEVDGTIVMPGQGMTTAGTPMRVTSHAQKVAWTLTDLRTNLGAKLSALDSQYPVAEASATTWTSSVHDNTFWLCRGQECVPIADLTPP